MSDTVFQLTEEILQANPRIRNSVVTIRFGWWYFKAGNHFYGPYTTQRKAEISYDTLMERLTSGCAGGTCE